MIAPVSTARLKHPASGEAMYSGCFTNHANDISPIPSSFWRHLCCCYTKQRKVQRVNGLVFEKVPRGNLWGRAQSLDKQQG